LNKAFVHEGVSIPLKKAYDHFLLDEIKEEIKAIPTFEGDYSVEIDISSSSSFSSN
jgi:hypothetical protein